MLFLSVVLLTAAAACNDSGPGPKEVSEPLSPELEQVMLDIAALRGLQPAENIRAAAVVRDDVQQILAETLTEEDRGAWRNLTQLYRLVGFIGPDDDYEQLYLDFASRAVIGFYAPVDDMLWVVSDSENLDFATFDPTLRSTVAHELVHALQDHAYKLQELLRRAAADPDWALALSAVIEGDAVHHERLWAAKNLAGTPIEEGRRTVSGSGIPAALERELRFPYESGLDWADLLGALDANAATDRVLEGRRITTAEILHPDLANGWTPAEVQMPDVSSQLGDGWKEESKGSFGEFRLRNFLQLRLAGLPAVAGAAGWAGDQYGLYSNSNESVAALEVAFDSAQNADEFMSVMDSWLQASGVSKTETAAALADGRGFAVRRASPNTVLLVFGSNIDVTDLAIGTN